MTKFFNRFAQDESGVTAMEYGLIAALMAVVIITVFGSFGSDLTTAFSNIGTHLTTGK